MAISVILAHPSPGSFNHAIAAQVVNTLSLAGHQVDFHDLYREHFDPILTWDELQSKPPREPGLEKICNEIADARGLVFVHPNWWGQPPAILTGWIDRVLCSGVAYKFVEGDSGEGVPVGLLKARAALVINTSDTPMERELSVFGDPLDTIWKNCILSYCGVKEISRYTYSVVVTSTPQMRAEWLRDVALRAGQFAEQCR